MRYAFEPRPACNMCGSERRNLVGLRLNNTTGKRPRKAEGIAVPIKRCRVCGLIYPDPLPVPFGIADHYGVPPEKYWAEKFFQADDSAYAAEIAATKQLIDFVPGMTALDVGAGIGQGMIALQNAEFSTVGLEPSELFYRRAIDQMGIAKTLLSLSTIEDASFAEGSFDYITLGSVLEHLYDPARVLRKIAPWLKPNGIIYAEVPHADHSLSRLMNAYYRLHGTPYVTNCSPMHSPFHLYEFTPKSFKRFARQSGLSVVRHEVHVGAIRHAPAIVRPLLNWWMERRKTGLNLQVWLRRTGSA